MRIELIGGCTKEELESRIQNVAAAGKLSRFPGNVIEVLERHDKKFALGVQWHPEMMLDDSLQKLIFDAFVNACKE